jgi:hypothetical protein
VRFYPNFRLFLFLSSPFSYYYYYYFSFCSRKSYLHVNLAALWKLQNISFLNLLEEEEEEDSVFTQPDRLLRVLEYRIFRFFFLSCLPTSITLFSMCASRKLKTYYILMQMNLLACAVDFLGQNPFGLSTSFVGCHLLLLCFRFSSS